MGIWAEPTSEEQLKQFKKDLQEFKSKYYDIFGSDTLFDYLDQAELEAIKLYENKSKQPLDINIYIVYIEL